jgi:hypothetical protein
LAEESAYNQVKGAALKRKVAALVNELAEKRTLTPMNCLRKWVLIPSPILSKT